MQNNVYYYVFLVIIISNVFAQNKSKSFSLYFRNWIDESKSVSNSLYIILKEE